MELPGGGCVKHFIRLPKHVYGLAIASTRDCPLTVFTLDKEYHHEPHKKSLATTLAVLVFGVLTLNAASAASKWSDISSVTNGSIGMVHTKAGGPEKFSRTDVSAVTHKGVGGNAKEISHYVPANYRGSDLTTVTHHN